MKKDKKLRMAKYDPENAHAWNIILTEVRKLKTEGLRQREIAKKMGVNRDTVSRWLSEERGGERTTFGAMLRYADALSIPYNSLLEKGSLAIAEPTHTTPFDKAVGKILESCAIDADLSVTDIAKKTALPSTEVNAIFAGEKAASLSALNSICAVIEVGATMILKRATKQLEQDHKDTTANAARTRSA